MICPQCQKQTRAVEINRLQKFKLEFRCEPCDAKIIAQIIWPWQTGPPRRPGWYWWRQSMDDKPEIYRVYYRADGYLVNEGVNRLPVTVDGKMGQWSGPIPIPE